MSALARVTPSGRLSIPAEMRKRYGLSKGGEVVIEDTGDAIVIRTIDQIVSRAQRLSRELLAGKDVSVADFLAERRFESRDE